MENNEIRIIIEQWKQLDMPSKEEIREQQSDSSIDITDEYIKMQMLYRYLSCIFLFAHINLYRLDRRIYDQGYTINRNPEFYQKYGSVGMKFFYLRSNVYIERLDEEEYGILNKCLYEQDNASNWIQTIKMVEKTYLKVLATNPKLPKQWIELFPSIHGEGRVRGADILIGISIASKYDESGNLVSMEDDIKKDRAVYCIKEQLESVVSQQLDFSIRVIPEA